MLRPVLLAALMLGAATSSAAAPAANAPPLCRVSASSVGIPFPPLRTVVLRLRPECPASGHAFVRLKSSFNATDPVYGWDELTYNAPSVTFRGVLSNWGLEWKAASIKTYPVPEVVTHAGP